MENLDAHAVAAMLLALGALFLFTRERWPLQYTCLFVLTVLALGVEVFPYEHDGERLRAADFLAGFGNEALITIVLLLMLAKGIEISAALQPVARALARLWLLNKAFALLATLIATAMVSAFVNNTPIVVMLLPLLVGVAHRMRIPPSGILMPFGFAAIIGGMSTTIGTSSNLLVISVAEDLGVPQLDMFEFVLPAAITAGIAIVYLWLVAPRLLPERQPPLTRTTPRIFESIVAVTDASPLAGKFLSEVRALIKENVHILRVQRGKGLELVRLPTLTLRAGDSIYVRGTGAGIKEIQKLLGGSFVQDNLLRMPDQALVEIVVTADSPLYGRKLSAARGRTLGELIPIGIYRPGARTAETLNESADPKLESGDILLMQGSRHEIRELQNRHHLLILDRTIHVPRSAKAPLALGIMAAVVIVAAFGWLPIIASALCGVGLMLLGRCLALDEALSAIDAKLILVIVTSLGLGTALTETGAADFLAGEFVGLVRDLPPAIVLSGVMLFTALLTEIVTNNAVAVIGTPIAIVIARELGVPELPFLLAVLFGANMSYMTPIGYQTNLLVFSAGGYKFSDFFRVGIPLQVIVWLTLSIVLPILYL